MKKTSQLLSALVLFASIAVAQPGNLPTLEDFLQKHKIAAQTTTNDLRYLVSRKGTGPSPAKGDYVVLSYRAILLDSTIFDQTVEGSPLVFQVGNHEVIKGLDQGVLLLKKGATATLFVPSALGYQQYGVQGSVPPNADLVYELEILDILNFDQYDQYMRDLEERERAAYERGRKEQFQKDLQTIEAYAESNFLIVRRTNSGLSYAISKPGKGPAPKPGTVVNIAYEGFLTDGTLFDKSEKFEFTLGAAKVIEGWEEGLQYFSPGSEGWLLVPSKLAYGPLAVGKVPPNSVLIFKLKMLKK